jgi:hypothetical protein
MRETLYRALFLGVFMVLARWSIVPALEQRDLVSYMRGIYNFEFFKRHNTDFRIGAALHFAHGKQHDVLLLDEPGRSRESDIKSDREYLDYIDNLPRTEPVMELFAPYTAQSMFDVFRAIDWTHMHHEQTYDILSDASIPWNEKKQWTDRSVKYYLANLDIPRSPAPLDVTMRRAGVMMKPYFSLFRNRYPLSNNFFFAAHWWHPVVYEGMMIGGNGAGQEKMLGEIRRVFHEKVLVDRPQRMLLSREIMPRYSRMSPESANIFDNLHMLHGIVYDILAYEGWTVEQKKAEVYRVVKAMSYQPGDEKLARKFTLPRPDFDPRVYDAFATGPDGEMNRIMREMMDEMMPMMMHRGMDEQTSRKIMDQFRMKLMPGMQEGEYEGSLSDALKKVDPGMKSSPGSMEPGAAPEEMIRMMLDGWKKKYGNMPDAAPLSMEKDPGPAQVGGLK